MKNILISIIILFCFFYSAIYKDRKQKEIISDIKDNKNSIEKNLISTDKSILYNENIRKSIKDTFFVSLIIKQGRRKINISNNNLKELSDLISKKIELDTNKILIMTKKDYYEVSARNVVRR